MADTKSIATLMESTTSKILQLQQAFAELESCNAISLNLKWKELEEHFHGLEKSMQQRFHDLEDQEKDYETKISETQVMLEKREAMVVAKEQSSLERLQEKRNAALSAIGYSFDKYRCLPSDHSAIVAASGISGSIFEDKSDGGIAKIEAEELKPAQNCNLKSNPLSELARLCKEVDVKGIHTYISDNRKNLSSIREEIPTALQCASNPFSLVLESLKGFYSGEIQGLDGKKDANLLGMRRTCLMLMESLDPTSQMLTADLRELGKEVAMEWKHMLKELGLDSNNGNCLEVHAFLQLLASFKIAYEFNEDDICELIPYVSRRRQTADLCRSLGLSERMPGVIEVMMNKGRFIEAINMAYAFELTERFPPVPLLKTYLKEAKKVSPVKTGNTSHGAQNELNERELSALKVVIKCVEEHKLEHEYSVDSLQKRVLQLEKAKADKRRAAEAAKPLPKRPRANVATYAPRMANNIEKSFYRSPDTYQYPYDRQLVYQAEACPPMLRPASYSVSTTHSAYYGHSYPVQVQYQAPYIH